MTKIDLKEAETCLAALVKEAANGEEVIITQKDGPAFKLVPIPLEKSIPKCGSAGGQVKLSDDFNEPLTPLEQKHREGYEKHPVARGEFDAWEMDRAWGDP